MWMNGLAGREIDEALGRPDLVALEYAAVPFDGLHKGAGFALFGGASLAIAVAAQSRLQGFDAFGTRREIMLGDEARVERLVAADPLQPRHHAGQWADVLAIARDGLGRRDRTITAAGDERPAARA